MRHLFLLIWGVVFVSTNMFAQSRQLKAYIDHKSYYSPATGSYAEIHYQFVGHTLKYEAKEGGLQTKVAVGAVITNSIGDTVAKDIYILESPFMRDSIIEDFYDIQRFPLKPGSYTAFIELKDLVANATSMNGKIDITVQNTTNKIVSSDILIAEVATRSEATTVFSKSGFEIIPRISNFYGQGLNTLPYYVELYNTHTINDSVFGFKQRIVSATTGEEIPGFSRFTRMKTDTILPVLRKVDISKLPSGSYRLELDIVDRTNLSISPVNQYFFERVNEIETTASIEEIILDPTFQSSITEDSLQFYLASLIPIARPAESRMILETLKTKNLENYRKHIQQFWVQTSGTNAANAWAEYKKQVLLVEKLYATNFQDGFETDRGRVYLQYGPPNSIVQRETSPNEYPYEIWHYYKIKMYSNKRFIFYNPDLVNNAYRLLHSDMIGELQNYRWQKALSVRDSNGNTNVDDPNDGNNDNFGGNSQYNYRQY